MAGFLTTGLSALIGARAALDVTGHNIANANTPGYSRQRINFVPQQPQITPVGYIGNGVTSNGIERILDRFITEGIVDGQAASGRLNVLADVGGSLSNLLADPNVGLAPSLDEFFAGLQDAAGDPASLELRTLVLGRAEALTERFRLLSGELNRIEQDLNSQVAGAIDEINSISSEIADLNDRIVLARRGGTNVANDLLDQRDLRIQELAGLLAIETTEDSDGYINIVARPGTSLVAGVTANQLVAGQDPLNPALNTVRIATNSGASSAALPIAGGKLGALLEARGELVQEARRELGLTALGLAESLNAQLGNGLDLNDNFGANLFGISLAGAATGSTQNTGTAQLDVAVGDVSQLQNTDYLFQFDGSNFTALRTSDNSAVSFSGTGTALDPFVFDGLEVSVSGAAVAGDSFSVRPLDAAAADIRTSLTDPRGLAFAAPVRSAVDVNNLGDGTISPVTIVDPDDPLLQTSSNIVFIDTDTYSVNGGAAQSFNSGDIITLNGVEVVISGSPQGGDQFSVVANAGGNGDNSNLLLINALQSEGVLKDGSQSVLGNYASLVTEVGASTRNLQASAEAQNVLLASRIDAQQAVSGVDLDEEAANLIRYQQSYQAAAQLVAVANTLFEELIGAVR